MSPLVILLAPAALAIAATLYIIGPHWDWLSPSSKGIKEGKPARRRRPPVGGTDLHQLWHIRKLWDFHAAVFRRYRTARFIGFHSDSVFTVDPVNIEYIVKTNYTNYGKGKQAPEKLGDILGNGIAMVDGDSWRYQRKTASPQFSGTMIKNSATAAFKKNAVKLAAKISESANKAEIIAIDDLFAKSTADSIFEILASIQLNALSGENAEGSTFLKALDDGLNLIMSRQYISFWKIMRYFNVGYEARLKQIVKIVDNFVYAIIRDRINDKHCDEKGDFLSRLLEASSRDSGIVDRKYVRDEFLNFVIAGKDTTAAALSWFIYMLCKHPSVQEKIFLEIKEATKSSGEDESHAVSFQDFAEDITEEAIGKMHYLHAAISETLRLRPSIPAAMTTCLSDDVLPDGFSVRKGDMVGFHPYAMGRLESLWGEDAQLFRPERWIDEHGRYRPESPYKYSVFQAGPHVCIGKDFAIRQMKVYAAQLLRFFRFEMADKNEAVDYKLSIALAIANGLHVYAYSK